MNENPTYEHNMDIKKENKDTQKYTEIIVRSMMK